MSATVTNSTTGRTAVVNYTATKSNMFMGIFGYPTTTVIGSSTAQAGLTTNIDFYLLLDNSPSMNIAATSAGITTMVAATSAQGGCAFACHEFRSLPRITWVIRAVRTIIRWRRIWAW